MTVFSGTVLFAALSGTGTGCPIYRDLTWTHLPQAEPCPNCSALMETVGRSPGEAPWQAQDEPLDSCGEYVACKGCSRA